MSDRSSDPFGPVEQPQQPASNTPARIILIVAGWSSGKVREQRLVNQRIRLTVEKKLAIAKQSRRDIADLLIKNRVETAKLRTETLIAEDIQVELLELIELYTETLHARFALLEASKDAPDPAISDAVCAVVYAAPHTELRELHLLREMLMFKFGRNWAISIINNTPSEPTSSDATPSPPVPQRVTSKLAVYVPPPELVNAYLEEIARGYGVDWKAPVMESAGEEEGVGEGIPGTFGGVDGEEVQSKAEKSKRKGKGKAKPEVVVSSDEESSSEEDEDNAGGGPKEAPVEAQALAAISQAEAALKLPPPSYDEKNDESSAPSIALPAPPSDAPATKKPAQKPPSDAASLMEQTKKDLEKGKGEQDDFDALTARFAALKKR